MNRVLNKAVYKYMLTHKLFRLKEFSRYLVSEGYSPWLAEYWVMVLMEQGIVLRIARGLYKVNQKLLKNCYPYMEEVIING